MSSRLVGCQGEGVGLCLGYFVLIQLRRERAMLQTNIAWKFCLWLVIRAGVLGAVDSGWANRRLIQGTQKPKPAPWHAELKWLCPDNVRGAATSGGRREDPKSVNLNE